MADREQAIHLQCDRSGNGWQCRVTVGDDPAATTHEVEVTDRDLASLSPNAEVERLVEASFRFLLEREPREAILRRFDLPVIERYFPDYAAEIRRGL
jgi:hypothetical protein